MSRVTILHPGNMGITLAGQAQANGNEVTWCSAGRSEATRNRAEAAGLIEAQELSASCKSSDYVLSVCPPEAAEDVCAQVVETGFKGVFVEANAISPQRSRKLASLVNDAGAQYVDGGIVGPPGFTGRQCYLYLSGPESAGVAQLFENSGVNPKILGDEVGKASAMKMCFASHTKGGWALTLNTLAAAHAYGLMDDLLESWENTGRPFTEDKNKRLQVAAGKAWRFDGEMEEVAATLADADLPDGMHVAAAEIYRRLSGFKDNKDADLDDILNAIVRTNEDA